MLRLLHLLTAAVPARLFGWISFRGTAAASCHVVVQPGSLCDITPHFFDVFVGLCLD